LSTGSGVATSAGQENIMEVIIILSIIAGLAALDWLAITFGADSRIMDQSKLNW
jgi:hypothetical protein